MAGSEEKRRRYLEACESNLVSEVRLLLESGADVNWRREEDGQTGLHLAAVSDCQELLELLLAQTGVKVNIRDQNYRTPLMAACISGQERIVRRLCQAPDVSLNCPDDNGLTALHFAVKFSPGSSSACVSVLRNEKCSCPSYRNVAQLAVESYGLDSIRCVELLARDGRVDWSIKNRYGDTPLMYCMKNNKSEMAKIILEMEERLENKQLGRSEEQEDAKSQLVKKEQFIKHEAIIKQEHKIKLETNKKDN